MCKKEVVNPDAYMRRYDANRRSDVQRSRYVEGICDSLYRENGMPFHRVDTREWQVKGVDVIFPRIGAYVDEKAAIQEWYRHLNTYAVEMTNCVNCGGDGWMFAKCHVTTHFAFVYVESDDMYFKSVKDIEVIVVPKNVLAEYLIAHGIACADDAKALMRNVPVENCRRRVKANGVTLVQNLRGKEKSINVLVPRNDLRQMSQIILRR